MLCPTWITMTSFLMRCSCCDFDRHIVVRCSCCDFDRHTRIACYPLAKNDFIYFVHIGLPCDLGDACRFGHAWQTQFPTTDLSIVNTMSSYRPLLGLKSYTLTYGRKLSGTSDCRRSIQSHDWTSSMISIPSSVIICE